MKLKIVVADVENSEGAAKAVEEWFSASGERCREEWEACGTCGQAIAVFTAEREPASAQESARELARKSGATRVRLLKTHNLLTVLLGCDECLKSYVETHHPSRAMELFPQPMEPIDLNGLSPMFRWRVVNELRRMAHEEGRRMESDLEGWSDEPSEAKSQMIGWLSAVKTLYNLKPD